MRISSPGGSTSESRISFHSLVGIKGVGLRRRDLAFTLAMLLLRLLLLLSQANIKIPRAMPSVKPSEKSRFITLDG